VHENYICCETDHLIAKFCYRQSVIWRPPTSNRTARHGTVRYGTVRYGTVQYGTVQCSTVQCSTVQYSTVQYSTVRYSTVRYSTVRYSTVRYSTVRYSTVRYSTRYSTVQKLLASKSPIGTFLSYAARSSYSVEKVAFPSLYASDFHYAKP